jgi:DUF917 family protein
LATASSTVAARQVVERGQRVHAVDRAELIERHMVVDAGRSVELLDPMAQQEKLCDGPIIARMITMIEAHLGRKFDANMLWEVGGNNGFQPFLAGALLGLPVVDCDAMGRAFPQADMTTFAICDLPAYLRTMVDIRDDTILFTRTEIWTWIQLSYLPGNSLRVRARLVGDVDPRRAAATS